MKLFTGAFPPIAWRRSATLVIAAPLKGNSNYDYKICMLKRPSRGTFKDAYVFPGGASDPVDDAIVAKHFKEWKVPHQSANELDTLPMRVCAVREAFEEAGMGVLTKPVDVEKWRPRVNDDANVFMDVLEQEGVLPDINSLYLWCSFITPDVEAARMKKGGFETAFYLVVVGEEDVERMACCGSETVVMDWFTPRQALDAYESQQIGMPPPQWTVMRELQHVRSIADLPAYATSPQRSLLRDHVIKPCLLVPSEGEAKGEGQWLAYPGDQEHGFFPSPGGINRLHMLKGKYVQECNVPADARLTLASPPTVSKL